MNDNKALERIVARQKPKVPIRVDVVEELATNDLKTPISQDLQSKLNPDSFTTVRNTIRIESSVDEGLRQLCHLERITKETLLEAAYLFLQDHPDQLAQVVAIAQGRLQERKAIANYQRAKTMQERFLNS
jgi:hypothetical protein